MSTDSLVESSTLERTFPEWSHSSADRWRVVTRFSVAAAASAAVCLIMWSMVPRSLSGRIEVIGYPTFANYDHMPAFWAYRLLVYAFPLLLITFYAILARRGPLRRRTGPSSRGSAEMLEPLARTPAAHDPTAFRFGVIPRIALPLGVVVSAAGARDGYIDGIAVACGVIYLLLIVSAGMFSSWAASRTGSRTRKAAFWHGTALANGAGGSAAAFLGLWFVSRHTVVFVQGTGRSWPWMPLWLAILGVGAVLGWTLRQNRQGRSAWTIERNLLVVVVGSVALFLAMSVLPTPIEHFEGF
ncbi:MAG: hypothetical protein QOE61_3871, partial [Micromonosporaceae bacterium]|nr:hypothetical protein [Micromonosporaceae bacterium]